MEEAPAQFFARADVQRLVRRAALLMDEEQLPVTPAGVEAALRRVLARDQELARLLLEGRNHLYGQTDLSKALQSALAKAIYHAARHDADPGRLA